MQLLERGAELTALQVLFESAKSGAGRLALISGEAGIGKTSFVEHFAASAKNAQVLRGYCDPLLTPTPLGPLFDIAQQLGGKLSSVLDAETQRSLLFPTLLYQLQSIAPVVVLIFEDIHWADDATLDLIRYLARRLEALRVLFIVTCRDDEIPRLGAVRSLLGGFAGSSVFKRIQLSQLSLEAVQTLSSGIFDDAATLHARTAGNPLFVSEILQNIQVQIPESVRDIVLSRLTKLSPSARELVEVAAVIGSRIEPQILQGTLEVSANDVSESIDSGLLIVKDSVIAFRHELLREAILYSFDPWVRQNLYRRVLKVASLLLRDNRNDYAQIAHYAEGASDAEAVVRYGMAAANAAQKYGAHREAASHFKRVLKFSVNQTPETRGSLLMKYADECALVDDLNESCSAFQEAAEIWNSSGNPLKYGEAMTQLAWPMVRSGRDAEAQGACTLAIEILEPLGETQQLASAYRMAAHLKMLDRDRLAATHLGNKAIDLAERLGDNQTVAGGELAVGTAILVSGDLEGRKRLNRCIALAEQHHLESLKALAMLNIGTSYGELYMFADAERELAAGIAFARDSNLEHSEHYMTAWLALVRMYQGRWQEATDLALMTLAQTNLAIVSRIMALIALGRVRVRRGDPAALTALDEAYELAVQSGTLQRVAPVLAARAEFAWLEGEAATSAEEAHKAFKLAQSKRHSWHTGEFCYWLMCCEEMVVVPDWVAQPFALQIAGSWREAADSWSHLGCPYEQARALAEGDVGAQFEALKIFDALGAKPAAAMLRQTIRLSGTSHVPRGIRSTTRGNPFGLTRRELEILPLLTQGLTNGEIALKLRLSVKTVGHHVSSVLSKLAVTNRKAAGRIALQRGII